MSVGLKIGIRRHVTLGTKLMRTRAKLKSDTKGGPLVEESLLLGLAVVTVSIIIAVILEATGWAQDVVNSLFQLLQNSWNGLTGLLTP